MPQHPASTSMTSAPGMLRSSAAVAAVPASAFWWQWPWNRTRRPLTALSCGRTSLPSAIGLQQQFLRQPRGRGHGLRRRVAGQQGRVLVAQRQQA